LVESSTEEDSTSPISAVANTPGELLWRQDIDYTPTGQKRTAVGTSATATGFSSRRVDWAYDELDRLISEQVDSPGTANDYQTRYTLDMVGNRLSEVKIDGGGSSPTTIETTHSYRVSATGYLDILTGTSSWKSAAGASQQLVEEVAFGYDLNGSMITRTTTKPDSNGAPNQDMETFSSDAAGRLTGFIADDLDPQTPADTTLLASLG
jgi:hypothetical protein